MTAFGAKDPNTLSNFDQVRTKHLSLDLKLDFAKKLISGSVTHSFVAVSKIKQVVLDTRFIKVDSVSLLKNDNLIPLEHKLDSVNHLYGSSLSIFLDREYDQEEFKIKILYSTTEKCTAAQWLSPEQTVGKKYPYMFTQCQAIHARSLVPCQDTPNVKITYDAKVEVQKPLTAVMSALLVGQKENESGKMFEFNQPCSIPSYLIALAAGDIAKRDIGPRSCVWSEPEVVEEAAWEFSDTENFISVGESLLSPYSWGRYDLLLLPFSFPYGGMENPCLTFVNPTVMAKDKSAVDVIIHEAVHSWFGNLVTTANWEHFWLNEGFTVFLERKILGRIHGQKELEFSAIIGFKALKESIEHYEQIGNLEFTALVPKLENVDPDDAFSSVPYEKGFNFLFYLETKLGGPQVFEPFIKSYVTKFAGKSISTEDFKAHLYEFFQDSHKSILDSVDWQAWLYGVGLPPVENKFDDTLARECEALCNKWDSCRDGNGDFYSKDLSLFSSGQKIVFLEKMLEKPKFPHVCLNQMASVYKMNEFQNAEISFRWQWLCLKADFEPIFPHVVSFLSQIGRMKFVRPLYRALSKCTNGNALAKETFMKNRSFYHPICSQMVAKDLGISS